MSLLHALLIISAFGSLAPAIIPTGYFAAQPVPADSVTVDLSQAVDSDPVDVSNLSSWSLWSEWSDCSVSCGGGLQTRVRLCDGGEVCDPGELDIDEMECNEWECYEEGGEWGKWSTCEDGFHFREKCVEGEEFCQFEEEECGMEEIQQWSVWGECDWETGMRSRERCGGEFGCEIEEEECEEAEREDWDDGVWGEWGPCVNGLSTRKKCDGVECREEEMKACQDQVEVSWSDWGECIGGTQDRSKCVGGGFWCEVESRMCGTAMVTGHWSLWGPCEEGFQGREKCNLEGGDCEYEIRECDDGTIESDISGGWSEWGPCIAGFQEREICSEYDGCKVDVKICLENSSPTDTVAFGVWSDWSKCDAAGEKTREKCFTTHCIEEVQDCFRGWDEEPLEETLDFDEEGFFWSNLL